MAAMPPHSIWRRSMPTKTREKKANAGKANALQKPLRPSEELAAVVGSGPLARGQVVSKMWEYIRSHNLQNPENRREILADDKLHESLRQGQGDHVRDEQAPHPTSEVREPGQTSGGI
jgi:hypothetical protein